MSESAILNHLFLTIKDGNKNLFDRSVGKVDKKDRKIWEKVGFKCLNPAI